MHDEHTIHMTPPEGMGRAVLEQESVQLAGFLVGQLGREYEISSDEIHERASAWEQTITVRKGSRIGADVDVSWNGTTLSVNVSSASTLGTAVMAFFTLPLIAAGGLLGYFHVGPYASLPGYRIAAILGALVTMIPGAIVASLVNGALGRSSAAENAALVDTIRSTLRSAPGATPR